MTTNTACPDCGQIIDTRGLVSHRRGERCRAATNAKHAEESGESRVGCAVGSYHALGLVRHHLTRYQPGDRKTRSKCVDEPWASDRWISVVEALPALGTHARKVAIRALWARRVMLHDTPERCGEVLAHFRMCIDVLGMRPREAIVASGLLDP